MEMQRRRLVVVRHAKSAWPPGVPDRQRPLGPRGQRDAPRMGQRIRDLVGTVDLAVISPSERTRQTWALLAPGLGEVPVAVDERVYADWGNKLTEVVAELPQAVSTALVLGHEPGVSQLVLAVTEREPSMLRDRVAEKFPTCAVAILQTELPWAGVGRNWARLQAFATPRD